MDEETLKEMLSILKEILKWTRIQATPAVKAVLEGVLSRTEYRRLYQAVDGSRTQQELASLGRLSQPRVSRLISSWLKNGLVQEVSPKRYVRLFDLEEMDIPTETD